MFDQKIVGGVVVDGTGEAPFRGDVATKNGVIVAIRRDSTLEGDASEVIDAARCIVTPGFVDVHTHFDGQATWDDVLAPSFDHGVTTIVMGNCGVGFAPVAPGSEQWLIGLMEGVEDIPGSALAEGIKWDWESFPQYLDALDARRFALDIGTQVPHGPVRAYVMGERGAKNEPATNDEIEAMAAIVREGIEAGALGFSTSRTVFHRAVDGEPVPGTFAAEAELSAIARSMTEVGRPVFEVVPSGVVGEPTPSVEHGYLAEVDLMSRLAGETGLPFTFTLTQIQSAPNLWREVLMRCESGASANAELRPQVGARPIGILSGWESYHAFTMRPTFQSLAHRPFDELISALQREEVKAAILSEGDLPSNPTILYESLSGLIQGSLNDMYVLGNPIDYEPRAEFSIGAIAARDGVDPLAVLYDAMLSSEGRSLMMLVYANYADGNLDAVGEMMLHPKSIAGLSDAGAHCGVMCDASFPTYLLSYWTRDRGRGARLPLQLVVHKQTQETAKLFGLNDRGSLKVGKRADLNVIDLDRLRLSPPRMVYDLPAGGRRFLQAASGYVATIVAGQVTRRFGKDTGARPGRLIRGAR